MSKTSTSPVQTASKPPDHLGERGKRFWHDVQRTYAITDPAGLGLLEKAAECLDTAELARKEIDAEGPFFTDRLGNRRPNPGIAAQRNAMLTFARIVRVLAIDVPPTETK